MKTSDLIGPALDWAVEVAKAGGVMEPTVNYWLEKWVDPERRYLCESCSTSWNQGGPIIEREKINVRDEVTQWSSWMWDATRCGDVSYYGPTPLIAVMRCYVASKLGDEIEIPEELK